MTQMRWDAHWNSHKRSQPVSSKLRRRRHQGTLCCKLLIRPFNALNTNLLPAKAQLERHKSFDMSLETDPSSLVIVI